jgi:hypothetical protein
MKLIYLASPYTHDDKKRQETRYNDAVKYLAKFMKQGYHLFSPIAHCHTASVRHGLPGDWQYWKDYCSLMVPKCDELWVLMIDGWDKSSGVRGEVELAESLNIPVKYIAL